jgi:hypothetical protein
MSDNGHDFGNSYNMDEPGFLLRKPRQVSFFSFHLFSLFIFTIVLESKARLESTAWVQIMQDFEISSAFVQFQETTKPIFFVKHD